MPFNSRAVALYLVIGAVVLGSGVWMAATGPTTSIPLYSSGPLNRLLGAGLTIASIYLLTPGIQMWRRRRDLAIEDRESSVVLRAVAGGVREVAWSSIQRVAHRPSTVDLHLQSGERIRVYGHVVGAGNRESNAEVARFLARRAQIT